MPSMFGGLPLDEAPVQGGSRFGGVPVSDDTSPKQSFLSEMGSNFKQGVQNLKDVASGNFSDIGRDPSSPKTEALGDKLLQGNTDPSVLGVARSALGNIGNTSPSDFAGALLEKFNATPEGKLVGAIGGINPVYNAVGTAVNRYVNPEIQKLTGASPDTIQLMELASAPLGLKKAGEISDPTISAAKSAAEGIKEGISKRAAGFNAMSPEDLQETGANLANNTSAAYKAVDDTGAKLGAQFTQPLQDAIKAKLANTDLDPEFQPKTMAALRLMDKHLEDNNGELTLGRFDQYRRLLGRAQQPEDVMAAAQVRNIMDKALSSAQDGDFSQGNADSASLLAQARATAAKEFRFNDLADLVTKAGGDPNKLKKAFTKFVGDEDNLQNYNDTEKAALKSAAERSPGEFLERMLGTFGFDAGNVKNIALPAITAGTSAVVPGGAPLVALGTGLRYTGKLAARGAAQNAIDTVLARDTTQPARPVNAPAPPPAPMLALPAPKTTINVDSEGRAIPLTPSEREILGRAPSTKSDQRLLPAFRQPDYAKAQTSSAFDALEAEASAAKKMQIDKLWQQNTLSPQQLISEAIQRLQEAGLQQGELGNALSRILKDQSGSVPIGRMTELMKAITPYLPISGAAQQAQGRLQQSASTGGIGDQNMQQLQKLKETMPQSNAAPDIEKFAKAESSNNPNAKNPNSTASGLYQFTNKTWADMVSKYGKQVGITLQDKNNPQAQTYLTKKLAEDNAQSLTKTLGRAPNIGELYIAHVLGAGGAAKLINADPKKQAVMLFPKQVLDANRSIFFDGKQPRTAGEIQQLLSKKVS